MKETASETPAIVTVASAEQSVEWRPVVGWEDFYDVSSIGRIRCRHNHYTHGRILKHHYDKDGYDTAILTRKNADGARLTKTLKVHRLVAMAFIPNPDQKPFIDHINGDKADNRVCNIRWCTPSENNDNPITKMRQIAGQKRYLWSSKGREAIMRAVKGHIESTSVPVMCIETGECWSSGREASRCLHYSQANIARSCKQKTHNTKYFTYRGKLIRHFRYATQEEYNEFKCRMKQNDWNQAEFDL